MGIGKQVADAYIDVHGDLSKFRKDLNAASGTMADWATDMSDTFTKSWGNRTRSQMDRQWNSVIDMMHSGKKVDFNRMIENFDPTDLENSFLKINNMLDELSAKKKISEEDARAIQFAIGRQTKALQEQAEIEGKLAADREMWGKAHERMMLQLTNARKLQAESESKMWRDAFAENKAWDASRKKMLTEAYAMDQRFNAGRMKMIREAYAENVRFDSMKKKFSDMMRAEESKNLADAYAENKRFDALKRKVAEMSRAAESRQLQDAIRDNEAWAKSYQGVMHAASKIDLEQKFKNIGFAMETNDWSRIAQGAKNMSELRNRTTQTTREMVNLGRMTEEQFAAVQARLGKVGVSLGAYNVKFDSANKAAGEHGKSWTLIQKMISSAGQKFAGFSGLNVMGDLFKEGAAFFQDLDRNAVKLGKMALSIGSVGSAVVSMIGGVAVAGQDLAKIGQISILGPAFFTGAAIGAGVLIAALKDMGNVLKDLKPRFEELQDSISTNFWNVAEAPIRNLVDALLPTLSTKLGETATALGGMFAALSDSLASISTDEISLMFDRMNAGIANATGAMDPLVQAFNTMGLVGSQYFERFGTWITEISTQFNAFIQGTAADGRLQSWIEEAISSIQSAWSILGSGLSIFNAIGNAAEAAGIGGLFLLSVNLEKVAALVNSPAFQTTLTQLFAGAADATRSIGTALLELGPAIQSFMPTLAAGLGTIGQTVGTVIGYLGQVMASPVFQRGLTDFLTGVQAGVAALAPAILPMGESLGQIGSLLGQVAGQVGEVVAAMAVNLSPVLDIVTAAFARITFAAGPEILSIIETLGGVLRTLVDTILPPLENLVMAILPLIAPAFEALVPIVEAVQIALAPFIDGITALVEMIGPVLIPALQQISEVMTPVIEVFGIIAEAIMSVLVPVLGVVLIGAINSVVGVFQGFSDFVMGIVGIVTALFTGFGDFFTQLFQGNIGGALTALGTMFGAVWDGIVQAISGALEFAWNLVNLLFIGKLIGGLKTGLTSIGSFFKSSWDEIGATIMNAMQKILSLVTTGLQNVLKFVTTVLTSVLNFFKTIWTNIGSFVSTALSNLRIAVSGGMNGVKSLITAALNAVKGFFTSIWNGIVGTVERAIFNIWRGAESGLSRLGSAVSGALNSAVTFFRNGFTNMVTATSTGISNVMTWVTGIPAKISAALSGLGTLLHSAGTAIIDGLLNGLKATWTKVTDFVGGIASWIADNKGPLPYDRRLLIPAGNAIMEGLGKGLEDKLGMLKSTLDTVTDTMTDSVTAAFAKNKMYLAGADAALGLADGLKSNKRAVAGALDAVMPAATTSISASLVATGVARTQSADSGAVAAAGTVIEAGAIVISTPTKNPEIVASKVIDGFANYSNL